MSEFGPNDMSLPQSLAQMGMRLPSVYDDKYLTKQGIDPNTGLTRVNMPMNNWEKFGLGANALTGLAGAYSAYKQTGLMEDQLNMQRALANRNIHNSAETTNAQLHKAASAGAQMTGGSPGSEDYQLAYDRLYRPVDGSPVA